MGGYDHLHMMYNCRLGASFLRGSVPSARSRVSPLRVSRTAQPRFSSTPRQTLATWQRAWRPRPRSNGGAEGGGTPSSEAALP
jgi:hypothetical protein